MRADLRHIRQLTLTAGNRVAVRHVLPELEDAFRTASLPCGAGGGVILIRKLDLGTVPAGAGRHALAQRLEQRLASMAIVRMAAGDVPPADAQAVHWPDRVSLLVAAFGAVAAGQGGLWWVRQTLAASDDVAAPRAALLRLLRETGPESLGAMMAQALHGAWAVPLLRRHGDLWRRAAEQLCPQVFAGQAGDATQVALPGNARSVVAFIGEAPGIAAVVSMFQDRLQGLLSVADRRAMLFATAAISGDVRLALMMTLVAHRHGRGAVRAIWADVAHRAALVTANPPRAPQSQPAEVARRGRRPVRAQGPSDLPAIRREKAGDTEAAWAGQAPRPALDLAQRDDIPAMTRLGGAVVLINLIRLCGVAAQDPDLGPDIALRCLWRLLSGCVAQDAVLTVLPQPIDAFAPRLAQPMMPALWTLRGFGGRLRLARISPQAGQRSGLRAILAPHGTAILAVVTAGKLRQLRDAGIRFRPGRCQMVGMEAVLAGQDLVLRRAYRQLVGQSLRPALRRGGYLTASQTHIDVTLDLDDVRIRERKAGLDFTPGWVDWLGRVVTLTFERFDKPYGSADAPA